MDRDPARPDRYDVAALIFRFWWVVVVASLALSVWLLRSVAHGIR